APAAEQVEARRRPRDDGRRTHRHVEDAGGEPDAVGAAGDPAEQRPRLVEPRLVGVVLDRDEGEAELLRPDREVDGAVGRVVARGDEDAELERVAVVHQARSAATTARTAGAISCPKVASAAGSSPPRMKPLMPYSRTRAASCSAHCAGGPTRRRSVRWEESRPPMLRRRRTARGSRPAAVAASSMVALASVICWRLLR